MYENVLITGLVLKAPRQSAEGHYVEPPRVVVWGVNENLRQRMWTVSILRMAVGVGPVEMELALFEDTLHLLVDACCVPVAGEPSALESLQHAILANNLKRAEEVEHAMRLSLSGVAAALCQIPESLEAFQRMEAVLKPLEDHVVGHVVKAEFVEHEYWINVARHALHVIRSEADGKGSFGGRPVAELLKEFGEGTTERGAEIRQAVVESQAQDALAAYYGPDVDIDAVIDGTPAPKWGGELF